MPYYPPALPTTVQGDTFYASGTETVVVLPKDTNATRSLTNTGASNNPAWAQVNLTNGVTGTLPVANGGTGIAAEPRVQVTNSTSQAGVVTSTWTSITFDTEIYDTDTMHSTSSNTSRLTATTAGLYQITGVISWDSDTTNERRVRVLANGATIVAGAIDTRPTAGVAVLYHPVHGQIHLAASGYVELQVWQNSGSDRTVARDGGTTPYFAMVRVGG